MMALGLAFAKGLALAKGCNTLGAHGMAHVHAFGWARCLYAYDGHVGGWIGAPQ